ncbi:MAG TPA: hypothetical protein VGI17_06375 [Solirubrobacterales bacterium]
MAAVVAALAVMGLASSASAHSGLYARFDNCPSTNPTVKKCIQAVTNGGEVLLGKKAVPIVNPVTLQGGVSAEFEKEEHFFNNFIAATPGPTLTPVAQPVPGGLTGLVNCKEISNFLVRLGCEAVFENGLTGVNSTLELARPASEIIVSEENLAFELGLAMQLPVKVHLENPLLGSTCYIGSSSSPIIWNLTTGTTKPPAGTSPITGTAGILHLLEGGDIAEFENAKLVDNTWSAPGATGCGGFGVELILDPIINSSVGVPSAAGKNAAILDKTRISVALAESVNKH